MFFQRYLHRSHYYNDCLTCYEIAGTKIVVILNVIELDGKCDFGMFPIDSTTIVATKHAERSVKNDMVAVSNGLAFLCANVPESPQSYDGRVVKTILRLRTATACSRVYISGW